MDGVEYNLNEAISDLAKRSKDNTPIYKRRWFIGVMIGASVFIIILIVLLVVLLGNGDNNDSNKIIGEINCEYRIDDSSKKVNILGEEFVKGKNVFDILVNGEKIEYTQEYKFPN